MIDAVLNFLKHRKRNYQRVFNGQDAEYVMQDLARFCRAEKSCFHTDARTQALLEGRREVWLRIKHHLDLTEEELKEIYTKGKI